MFLFPLSAMNDIVFPLSLFYEKCNIFNAIALNIWCDKISLFDRWLFVCLFMWEFACYIFNQVKVNFGISPEFSLVWHATYKNAVQFTLVTYFRLECSAIILHHLSMRLFESQRSSEKLVAISFQNQKKKIRCNIVDVNFDLVMIICSWVCASVVFLWQIVVV